MGVAGSMRVCALVAALASAAAPAAEWSIHAAVGFPLDLPLPVTIRQRDEASVRFRARRETRPFEAPWYYDLRASRRSGGGEWSVDLLHHKLYVTNPPPEVQRFGVSHGYNLLLASHAREIGRGVWARVGAGLVIAHPETTVRGRTHEGGGPLGGGYHPAGPTVAVGAERRFAPAGPLLLTVQGLATASWARVPVADGHATVPDVALHVLGGVGLRAGRDPR
jgi:hypothetical protein